MLRISSLAEACHLVLVSVPSQQLLVASDKVNVWRMLWLRFVEQAEGSASGKHLGLDAGVIVCWREHFYYI